MEKAVAAAAPAAMNLRRESVDWPLPAFVLCVEGALLFIRKLDLKISDHEAMVGDSNAVVLQVWPLRAVIVNRVSASCRGCEDGVNLQKWFDRSTFPKNAKIPVCTEYFMWTEVVLRGFLPDGCGRKRTDVNGSGMTG